MLQAFKGLLSSKKFWLTIIGSALIGALSYAHAPQELIITVASLFGVNILGQGVADMNKK